MTNMEIGFATIYFYPAENTYLCTEAYYVFEARLREYFKKHTLHTVNTFFQHFEFHPHIDFVIRYMKIYEIKYHHNGCTMKVSSADLQFIEWLKSLLEERYGSGDGHSEIKMAYLLADDLSKTFIAGNQEGFGAGQIYRVFEPMGYTSDMSECELYEQLKDLCNVMNFPKPDTIQTAIFLVESYQNIFFKEEEERYLCFPYKEQIS